MEKKGRAGEVEISEKEEGEGRRRGERMKKREKELKGKKEEKEAESRKEER